MTLKTPISTPQGLVLFAYWYLPATVIRLGDAGRFLDGQ
jgi:hypothetical protein